MSRLDYLRPSAAATWFKCRGYAALMDAIGAALSTGDDDDEADNEVREDGTACHWLAAEVWEGRRHAVGDLSPNQRALTEAMYEAGAIYLGVLSSWPNVVPVLEKTIPSAIQGVRDGTPDAWAYDATTGTLYVADLKYGFRFVEVWNNLQLIIYALSIIKLLGVHPNKIVFTIVQPRSTHRDGPVRVWETTEQALLVWHLLLEQAALEATTHEWPLCTPNPGCRDCPVRFGCKALQADALHSVHQAYSSTPHVLEPLGIGQELALLQDARMLLEARITGLEQQAEFLMRSGKRIPGFAMKSKYGHSRWRDEYADGLVALGKLYHIDIAKPLQAISPAQARAKGMPESVVKMLSFTPETGLKLVREDKYEVEKLNQRTSKK